MEYAVWPDNELASDQLARFAIRIDRGNLAARVARLPPPPRRPTDVGPEPLENLAFLVWTAHERLMRGEVLSAHQYLTGFAVNNLLLLFRQHGLLRDLPSDDALDPRRRLEQSAAELAREVHSILALPLEDIGMALLRVAHLHVEPVAPELNWPAIAAVRHWLTSPTTG